MSGYHFFDRLMLRSPAYSFAKYLPDRLPEVLLSGGFRDALFLASPDLYRLLADKGFRFDQLNPRERFTLLKYYNRICYRPTPFGAFAGFGMTRWGKGVARLEADFRLQLYPDRNELPGRERSGRIGLSPLVYAAGREFRIIRKELDAKASKFIFRLDAVMAERLTKELVSVLGKGPQMPEDLVSWVSARTGTGDIEARDWLNYLLDAELLIREDANDSLIVRDGAEPDNILEMDRDRRYYAVSEYTVDGGPAVQERAELQKAVSVLQRMAAVGWAPGTALDRFRSAFVARFADRMVPLLTALDPDSGIVYEEGESKKGAAWNALHHLFLRSWIQNRSRGYYDPLYLSDEEIDRLGGAEACFPPTTAMLFRKTGGQLLIEQLGGATGTALPGRFSLFSGEVHAFCREIAAKEQALNPEVAFAEINGESGPHVDNINLRRPVYPYEISLGGCVDPEVASQLPPSDLILYHYRGELQLFSRKLGRRVIPRLPTAFNTAHNNLGVFRLLADLQSQGLCTRFALDLQLLFPGLTFYPRVCYRNCIFLPAKWILEPADLPADFSGFTTFRKMLHLPQYVAFGKGDRQLVFNLSDPDDVGFFLDCIRNEGSVTVFEYLLPDRSVRIGHREMAGQYMAALYRDEQVYHPAPFLPSPEKKGVKRMFAPGEEWLYFKLYAAEASSGRVLSEIIEPFLRRFPGNYSSWFFIRYRDPEPHLRLRLKIRKGSHGLLIAGLSKAIHGTGRSGPVRYWYVDTYERELERYHPALIVKAEEVFHEGSRLVLDAVKGGGEEMRLAVRTTVKMLAAFVPDIDQQMALASRSADAFLQEIKPSKTDRILIDKAYRELRPDLATYPGPGAGGLISAMRSISKKAAKLADEQRARLLADLCHMQINRSFASEQRRNEMIVWRYVLKFLREAKARG